MFLFTCGKTMDDFVFLIIIPIMNIYYFYNQENSNKIFNTYNRGKEL